jgi:pyruvate-formate lyase-activating enzyme
MQIVLATSPHVRHPAVLQSEFTPDPTAMYSFAPVGLLALSSMLRQTHAIEPVLFDVNQAIISGSIPLDRHFYRSAAKRICAHEPDVLGFMTECDSYHHVLQIMEAVKLERPACRCVLGGPHATAVAKATMERRPFVDAVVLGEGERSFPDLARAFADGDGGAVAGTLRRDAGGAVLDGGPRPLVPNLDELPIPAYDMYPGTPGEEIFVEAGRGCPFQCTFCSTAPFWQRRHRVKSPARLLEEIRLVQRLFQSTRVHFTHDLLTTDKQWVRQLCAALVTAGTPVKWTCSARTDTVDRDLLELMARAGCNAIYFGIESGSARVLKDIAKDVPIERSLEVLHLCREVGIRPNAGFIAGFPSEDRRSLADTFVAFERALQAGTRPTHIFGFCPFAESSMYPQLTELVCDGHYLDVPIEAGLDDANRALVASDRTLFGAYFRPRLDVAPTRLQGIDEFSCLAEPVALPLLRLARALGGMLEVFDRWTNWIEARNLAAGVPAHRRFYGSPLQFCDFLVEGLRSACPPNDPMLQLAEVFRINSRVAREWASQAPTTMATHRSLPGPEVGPPMALGDALRLKAVAASLKLDYDLAPLLDASCDEAPEPERRPTCVIWQIVEGGKIRLSQVDPFLYSVIDRLQEGPQPVAALMVEWAAHDHALDYERLMGVLNEAKAMHIVETV